MLKSTAAALTLLLAVGLYAQEPGTGSVVEGSKIEATRQHSIQNNVLDTKVSETVVKGGLIRVGVVYRKNAEAAALMHQELTEIYQIIEGSGTVTIGGTMSNQRPAKDPPNLGPTPSFSGEQTGGIARKAGPKDLVIVPAGLPHRWTQLDGPISYVIYRFEHAQAK